MKIAQSRPWWRLTLFVFMMLIIEFMDELVYSGLEVARPLIRDSFALDYVQLGLITTIPITIAIFIEPAMGILADTSKRRLVMVIGGVCFGAGMILQGLSSNFFIFMMGASLLAPASGIFVNIAQASLMDDNPTRRENRMALWTFSGSLAVVTGPLLLTMMLVLGLDWRPFFILSGILSIILALSVLHLPASHALRTSDSEEEERTIQDNIQGAIALLRNLIVWRWLLLLEFSNLMLDVLFSLLALYMVDIVGVTQAQASIAIITWTGIGLIGDFLLIPLLERVRGLLYLRISAFIELILFPLFLLMDGFWFKLILLGIIGLFNAGWYAILQGKLYDALGEQSGAVLIVGNAAGLFGALLPLILGVIAQRYGLDTAMWILLAGPIVLLIALPRQEASTE